MRVNFDKIDWRLEGDSEDDNETQLTEEIIEVLAIVIEKSRHGEPQVVAAKKDELGFLRSMTPIQKY